MDAHGRTKTGIAGSFATGAQIMSNIWPISGLRKGFSRDPPEPTRQEKYERRPVRWCPGLALDLEKGPPTRIFPKVQKFRAPTEVRF
jgi:hypothetical protein